MKRTRKLKNLFLTSKKEIRTLLDRLVFNPNMKSMEYFDEKMIENLKCVTGCSKNLDVDVIHRNEHKLKLFKSIFRNKVASKFKESFIDTSVALLSMNASSCTAIKCVKPTGGIITDEDLLLAADYLEGTPTVRRKFIAVSSTCLVAENESNVMTAIPHIQIMMWEGYLNSPNGWIAYTERVLDKYRLFYIVKTATSATTFNMKVYTLDISCNVLEIEEFKNIDTHMNMFYMVNNKVDRVFNEETILDRLVNQHRLKLNTGMIKNEEKKRVKRRIIGSYKEKASS